MTPEEMAEELAQVAAATGGVVEWHQAVTIPLAGGWHMAADIPGHRPPDRWHVGIYGPGEIEAREITSFPSAATAVAFINTVKEHHEA